MKLSQFKTMLGLSKIDWGFSTTSRRYFAKDFPEGFRLNSIELPEGADPRDSKNFPTAEWRVYDNLHPDAVKGKSWIASPKQGSEVFCTTDL